ncbi:hypothetical protein GCM10020000_28410 [Streptomyces olivoverticillatus]
MPWLVLLIYVSISSGVLLPMKWALRVVPFVAACVFGISRIEGARIEAQMLLVLPTLLGGVAMMAVVQMSRTMRELRQARATVAHLAANEERLRLARDLHDLLGHSLSVITLKSELAGRMLPDKPEQAAQQVADIERVSRAGAGGRAGGGERLSPSHAGRRDRRGPHGAGRRRHRRRPRQRLG